MCSAGGLAGLSTVIWAILTQQLDIGGGSAAGSGGHVNIARRHGLSCLQRLSVEEAVAEGLATTEDAVHVLGRALNDLLANNGGKKRGRFRFCWNSVFFMDAVLGGRA